MPRQYALKVQDKVNKGWRKEASKLGQLWDVVRNGVTIASDITYLVNRDTKGADIEGEKGSSYYRARGDRRLLQISDQLVGKDIQSGREQSALLERYTVVGMRLLRETIVIRTEWRCNIYRPTMIADDAPTINPYSEQTVRNSPVLTFDSMSGNWSFELDGTPADVWCDINTALPTDYQIPDPVPLTTRAHGWTISHQLLPGVQLEDGDMIVDQIGNWFRIHRMDTQFAGFSFYQNRCTKVVM